MDDMKVKTKRKGSLLLLGVLVSMLLLAGSLSRLELRPGHSYLIAQNENSESREIIPNLAPILTSSTFIQGVLGLVFILIIFFLLCRLILRMKISQLAIREYLRTLAALIIILCVLYLLSRIGHTPSAVVPADTIFELPPAVPGPHPDLIGEVPKSLIWLAAGLVIGAVSLLAISSVAGWIRPTQEGNPFLQEAEQAVQSLQAGKDLSDVIIRCYLEMALTLRDQRGIERNQTMTVREFECRLALEGLPPGPVHQLTSLFESARYSKCQLGNEDHLKALQCLDEIINHCRGVQ